jgi:hypothetical protein
MLAVLLVQLRFSNDIAAARDGFSRFPDIYKRRARNTPFYRMSGRVFPRQDPNSAIRKRHSQRFDLILGKT